MRYMKFELPPKAVSAESAVRPSESPAVASLQKEARAENRASDHSNNRPLAVCAVEAARLLGCGRTKLFELLASGEIPSFQIGRRRLIRLETLESWLREQEAATDVGT